MAHGDYVLPDSVPANEFLNLEGSKLSTSRNYAVWLEDYLKNFEPDSLRYVLAGNMPESRDTDFSWKEFQARHNNELADILGNFVNRTFTFAHKYFSARVPEISELSTLDEEMVAKLQKAPALLGDLIDTYQFKAYVRELMDLARFANKYFNDKEPWKTRTDDPASCANTINLCLQTVFQLSVLAEPLLPFSARKIWKMLNLTSDHKWDELKSKSLEVDHEIGQAEILFNKIEDQDIEPEIDRLKSIQVNPKKTVVAEEIEQLIDIDSFAKTDLRVAEIIEAEVIKKSNKLLKLQVRIGSEVRQIVAGIAQTYKPEDLIGKKVVAVANLKPATLRGNLSEGMLLAASSDDKLTLVTLMDDLPSGSKIR